MIDKHGNEDCSHEQHETCPMDGDRCGCYVGHEACLKAEREDWVNLARVAFNERFHNEQMGG